jgi:hypothetical protein
MPTPAPEIVQLLSVFAIAFTAPTWKNAQVLLFGAILAPGRRTVTSALRVMGLGDEPRFEKYHRVLNRNRWTPLVLSKLLLELIIKLCVPEGMPLILAVDETLERRWGPKIKYLGVFRDPVRSTKKKVVYSSGVRWLSMAIVIPVPWGKRHWALPFLTVGLLSPKTSAKLGKRHRTSVARAGQLISQVRRWHSDRDIVVVGDGAFAAVPLIQHCQRKRIGVTLVSRLRFDARLFDLPGEQPKDKRGVKPKKGNRQPKLDERLEGPKTEWVSIELAWYGGEKRTLEIATGTSLWHRTGLDPVPIRWVLMRCPDDDEFEPAALFSSNQDNAAKDIVRWFVLRWNIEVTFEEVRMHLGFETQRQWSDKAIARTSPCLLGVFSLVVLSAIKLHPRSLPIQRTSWYDKEEATFSDALFAVRKHLWGLDHFAISPISADYVPIPLQLFRALRQIALYSV